MMSSRTNMLALIRSITALQLVCMVSGRYYHNDSVVLRVKDFNASFVDSRSVLLVWKAPEQSGVEKYVIRYYTEKDLRRDPYSGRIVEKHLTVAENERSCSATGLIPFSKYSFKIQAMFTNNPEGKPLLAWGPIHSSDSTLKIRTNVDDPPPFDAPEVTSADSDSSVKLKLKRASDRHGPIVKYLVIVVTETFAREHYPRDFVVYESNAPKDYADEVGWVIAKYLTGLPADLIIGDGLSSGKYQVPRFRDYLYRAFVRAYTSDQKFTDTPYTPVIRALAKRSPTASGRQDVH